MASRAFLQNVTLIDSGKNPAEKSAAGGKRASGVSETDKNKKEGKSELIDGKLVALVLDCSAAIARIALPSAFLPMTQHTNALVLAIPASLARPLSDDPAGYSRDPMLLIPGGKALGENPNRPLLPLQYNPGKETQNGVRIANQDRFAPLSYQKQPGTWGSPSAAQKTASLEESLGIGSLKQVGPVQSQRSFTPLPVQTATHPMQKAASLPQSLPTPAPSSSQAPILAVLSEKETAVLPRSGELLRDEKTNNPLQTFRSDVVRPDLRGTQSSLYTPSKTASQSMAPVSGARSFDNKENIGNRQDPRSISQISAPDSRSPMQNPAMPSLSTPLAKDLVASQQIPTLAILDSRGIPESRLAPPNAVKNASDFSDAAVPPRNLATQDAASVEELSGWATSKEDGQRATVSLSVSEISDQTRTIRSLSAPRQTSTRDVSPRIQNGIASFSAHNSNQVNPLNIRPVQLAGIDRARALGRITNELKDFVTTALATVGNPSIPVNNRNPTAGLQSPEVAKLAGISAAIEPPPAGAEFTAVLHQPVQIIENYFGRELFPLH